MNVQTLDFTKPEAQRPKGPNPKTTAVFCGLMAFLIFCVSAFLIVDGVRATEPDSIARYTRIAQGVTFLLGAVIVFLIGGLFPRFKKGALYFGITIFIINSVLMSISMISNGKTAGKISAQSAGVIATLEANNNATLAQIGLVQENAKKLSASRHDWNQAQASKDLKGIDKKGEDLRKDSEKLIEARTKGAAVSTPMIEIVGEVGLYIISGVLAVAMESLSGYLMFVMGSLLREASGAMTQEAQTLDLLHKINHAITTGQSPALPYLAPVPAAAPDQRAANDVMTATATVPDAPTATATMPKSWWSTIWKGALPVALPLGAGAGQSPEPVQPGMTAPPTISAPGRPQAAAPELLLTAPATAPAPEEGQSPATEPATALEQVQSAAPEEVQSAPAPEISRASPKVPETVLKTAPTTALEQVRSKAKKQKRIPAPKALLVGDTLSQQAQVVWVYDQVRDAVRAEEIKPSTRGLRLVIGCSDPIANGHLARMRDEGVIVFNTQKKQGWKLAPGQSTKQIKVA